MKGQRIGYVRVSSVEQNTDRQLEGLELDRTFADKASGKDTKRPALEELLRFVREGDVVIVHSIDRLARNLPDLRRIVEDLTGRGIQLPFVKENLTFSGDDSPMSTLLLSVMGAFAEFERALIRERQVEGIAAAKRRGVYKGRKKALSQTQVAELKARAEAHESKTELARKYGISRRPSTAIWQRDVLAGNLEDDMKRNVRDIFDKFLQMSKEDHEKLFAEATRKAIAQTHAAGLPTCHASDRKGYRVCYVFPDGHKEYFNTVEEGGRDLGETRPEALIGPPGIVHVK